MSKAKGYLKVGAYRQEGVNEECVNAEPSEMVVSEMLRKWTVSPMKTAMPKEGYWLWWQQ